MPRKPRKSAEARAVEQTVSWFALNLTLPTQASQSPDVFWGRALLDTADAMQQKRRRHGPDEDETIMRLLQTLECVECGVEVSMPSAYCCEFCKQVAGAVRYARKGLADGRREGPELHKGLGIKLIQLGHGGYPERARRLKPKLRQAILDRDQRMCQICGATATQVDHIDGHDSAPSNLRALCAGCNWRRALEPDTSATEEENLEWCRRMVAICSDLAVRIAASAPLKCCDDYLTWQRIERATRGARRGLYRERQEELETSFEDVDGYLAHAMAKDD